MQRIDLRYCKGINHCIHEDSEACNWDRATTNELEHICEVKKLKSHCIQTTDTSKDTCRCGQEPKHGSPSKRRPNAAIGHNQSDEDDDERGCLKQQMIQQKEWLEIVLRQRWIAPTRNNDVLPG